LSGRRYDYDNKGRRKIESKDVFKKRCGRSPDKGDAILLAYFQGAGLSFSDDIKTQMKNRRMRDI